MITKRESRLGSALAVLAALATFGTPARASNRGPGKVSLGLTATSAAPGARGRAVVIVRNSDGKLTVVARALQRRSVYDVILERVKIGTLTTTGGGKGKARFRARPRAHDQLLGTDPRGKTIILRGGNAIDVLVADIPRPQDPTPDDPSDDAIHCCLAHDGGTECEDRTADECMAQGGVNMGVGSCLPNPCGGSTGGALVVCCLPDDDGVECEDRTQGQCNAQGGTAVKATGCTPNPCAPVPPATPEIQCCLPDDDGFECEDHPGDLLRAGRYEQGLGDLLAEPLPERRHPARRRPVLRARARRRVGVRAAHAGPVHGGGWDQHGRRHLHARSVRRVRQLGWLRWRVGRRLRARLVCIGFTGTHCEEQP